VSDELSQRLQSHPTQFFETYGMTETLTHIALRRLNPPDSTFHALAGVRLLMDERQCLNIQANHLGADAIQTNDLVTISSDNSFRLVGRYDNVINTAGVKISPEAVEKKIATILSNNLKGCDFFIGSRKDRLLGERVVLFVENEEINNQRKNQILDLIRTDLKKWEVPKEIVCLPVFKRTPSGKVNRTATLRDLNS
jgi:O-succinylbenzoic acid--CoA ligase